MSLVFPGVRACHYSVGSGDHTLRALFDLFVFDRPDQGISLSGLPLFAETLAYWGLVWEISVFPWEI